VAQQPVFATDLRTPVKPSTNGAHAAAGGIQLLEQRLEEFGSSRPIGTASAFAAPRKMPLERSDAERPR